MSMLSLDPATTTDGWFASIATAGSFCLFCENGDIGLPTVTSVPAAGPATGAAVATPAPASTRNNAAPAAANLNVRIGLSSPLGKGPFAQAPPACSCASHPGPSQQAAQALTPR